MKNYFDVAGKYAVVTGASSGLGRQFALCLAEQGCNVAIAARRVERLEEVKKEVEAYGVKCLVLPCDVTDTEQIRNSVDKVVKEFGRIDILINNAAGGTPENTPMEELSFEQWKACMNGCLSHVFTMSQAFVKECKKSAHGGHIVNVSAKAAFHSASHNKIPYATAKGAIATLTQRMANDLIEDDIFVNAIVPGYVLSNYYRDPESPQCKAKEKDLRIGWATPEDMGNITAFLCSPLSRQIIGAVIDCSGGTML